jgi:hypothetical protein
MSTPDKAPLERTLHFRDDGKPLVHSVETIDRNAPLTHEIIEAMRNNIFVNLRTQFPNKSRRDLRAETRRRLNLEIKRRKELDRATSTKDAGSENLGPAVTDSQSSS